MTCQRTAASDVAIFHLHRGTKKKKKKKKKGRVTVGRGRAGASLSRNSADPRFTQGKIQREKIRGRRPIERRELQSYSENGLACAVTERSAFSFSFSADLPRSR